MPKYTNRKINQVFSPEFATFMNRCIEEHGELSDNNLQLVLNRIEDFEKHNRDLSFVCFFGVDNLIFKRE